MSIVRYADCQLVLPAPHVAALLNGVREFMGNEFVSLTCCWRILSYAKHHVLPSSVRQGIYRPRRLRRLGIGVHPHLAKVMTKAQFEESLRCWIKWLAGRAQHLVNDGRHVGETRRVCGTSL